MKLGEIAVPKFHQNWMRNKKIIISLFLVESTFLFASTYESEFFSKADTPKKIINLKYLCFA